MSYEALLSLYLKQPTPSWVVMLTYKTGSDKATMSMQYCIFNPTTATQ